MRKALLNCREPSDGMAKRIKTRSDLTTFEWSLNSVFLWLRPLLLEEICVDVPGISAEDLRRVAQNSFSRPASPMSQKVNNQAHKHLTTTKWSKPEKIVGMKNSR